MKIDIETIGKANNEITPQWRVKFNIEPSLRSSETIDNYVFEVINGKTYVDIEYETNEYEITKHPIYEHESKIKNLMLERMIYQRNFNPVIIKLVSGPDILNKDELSRKGLLRNLIIGKTFEFGWHVLDVPDSTKASHNFCQSGFNNKTKNQETEIFRIADWLQKATIEKDVINRFISIWIGFNGLYGFFDDVTNSRKPNDAGKFENAIYSLLKKDARDIVDKYSNVLDKLQTYPIKSKAENTYYNDKLKKERENSNRDDTQVIIYATRIIYGVRNQTFHEVQKCPSDIVDRAKNCNLILMPIVATCLKNLVIY
jgi:hypothetical protein